ncbi:hypothetical protein ACTNEF_06735 [Bariatricus sp. HCP28S3_E4]|uniref:hypothetical protein n=1 Tax=unclassified Bariatricus TaxID=2677046 RepID=UPI003F8BA321
MDDSTKIEIMLKEYQTLKEEERTLYSFEFTIVSIWLAFLGVLLGIILSQFNILYETIQKFDGVTINNFNQYLHDSSVLPESRNTIAFLVTVILPGVCSLFGLIWLDLTTRFIKEAHYIFMLEESIFAYCKDTSKNGFDHYLFNETRNEPFIKKTNYVYYYLMLGLLIICPIIIGIFMICNHDIVPVSRLYCGVFVAIEVLTLYFGGLYINRILSYSKEKEKVMDINSMTVKNDAK